MVRAGLLFFATRAFWIALSLKNGGRWHGHDHDREDPRPGRRQRVGGAGRSHHGASSIFCLGNDITAGVAIDEFEKAGFERGVRSREDRPHPRPLHAQQGHQVGRAGQADARVRPRSTASSTTTTWAAWAWSTPSCPSRAWWARATWSWAPTRTPAPTALWAPSPPASAPPTWRGPWPPARPGSGCRRPTCSSSKATLAPYVTGQRHRPFHHRPDRGGRRPLQGHGVHRLGHPRPLDGLALHHLQHGHRGGRQERHHRARRHHQGVRRGTLPRHPALLHVRSRLPATRRPTAGRRTTSR